MGALHGLPIDRCGHQKKTPFPTSFGQDQLCTSLGVRTSLEQESLYSAMSLLYLFYISSSLITHPGLQSVKAAAHFPLGKLILVCQYDERDNGCMRTPVKQ